MRFRLIVCAVTEVFGAQPMRRILEVRFVDITRREALGSIFVIAKSVGSMFFGGYGAKVTGGSMFCGG